MSSDDTTVVAKHAINDKWYVAIITGDRYDLIFKEGHYEKIFDKKEDALYYAHSIDMSEYGVHLLD